MWILREQGEYDDGATDTWHFDQTEQTEQTYDDGDAERCGTVEGDATTVRGNGERKTMRPTEFYCKQIKTDLFIF